MNLADVMDDVANRLNAIEGLRVTPHPESAPNPPAAMVSYPEEIEFDQTYGRGADRITLPVVLVVGKVFDRVTRAQLARYCDGTGAHSVKAVLESGTYHTFDTLRVVGIEFDSFVIGAVEHMAALFTLDIFGAGSS
jgi:hypothetical protein